MPWVFHILPALKSMKTCKSTRLKAAGEWSVVSPVWVPLLLQPLTWSIIHRERKEHVSHFWRLPALENCIFCRIMWRHVLKLQTFLLRLLFSCRPTMTLAPPLQEWHLIAGRTRRSETSRGRSSQTERRQKGSRLTGCLKTSNLIRCLLASDWEAPGRQMQL